ncbi:MAG TPA: hypothetical protein VHT01_04605 [Candidatus Udaeobacter sp.]|nr:hypothetical protein [Candidatus Udaeobacter sp.]
MSICIEQWPRTYVRLTSSRALTYGSPSQVITSVQDAHDLTDIWLDWQFINVSNVLILEVDYSNASDRPLADR